MGLYDRDYMKERQSKKKQTPNIDTKILVIALIFFILGILVCKIIL